MARELPGEEMLIARICLLCSMANTTIDRPRRPGPAIRRQYSRPAPMVFPNALFLNALLDVARAP